MADLLRAQGRTKKMSVFLLLLIHQSIFAKSEVVTEEDHNESVLNELDDSTGLVSVSDNCSEYGIDNLPHPRFILLGPTGVGKSTLANQLLGRNPYIEDDQVFSVGHGVESHTLDITWVVGNWLGDGPCFTIIDTPGTSDSEGRDYEYALTVANIMKDQIKSVDVFLLCFNGGVPRFDKPTIDLLKLYESIFSIEMWNHAVTEVTYWPHNKRYVRMRKRNGLDEMTRHKEWNSQYKEELNVSIEIPSVYIDPVLEVFDVEEREFLDEREIEAFNKYTDELFEYGNNSEPFFCDGNCKAPTGYFLGNPWIETNNITERQGEKAVIKCQIWNGIQGKAADNVTWTHNGEVIYQKSTSKYSEETSINSTDVWGSKVQFGENVSPGGGHYTDFIIEFQSLEESMEGEYICDNGENTDDSVAEVFMKVDGSWGDWAPWDKCSITCLSGNGKMGIKKRVREPIPPRYGGNPVNPVDGEDIQFCAGDKGPDYPVRCPVDGGWTHWSHWSPCSATCGEPSPTRYQYRSCKDPVPQYGGRPCLGYDKKFENCNNWKCYYEETGSIYLDGGYWGGWGSKETCTFPHFVTAMELKFEDCSDCDDTALNAIRLTCSDGRTISSRQGPWGNWRGKEMCSQGNYIRKAQIRRESKQGNGDDTAANGLSFWCTNDWRRYDPFHGYWGNWLSSKSCPPGSAVMGLDTQVDNCSDCDDTALNDAEFYCAKTPPGH